MDKIKEVINRLLNSLDTLQNNGKWSQKRLMTFSSFFIATIYAFLPLYQIGFDVKEFVFIGFLKL